MLYYYRINGMKKAFCNSHINSCKNLIPKYKELLNLKERNNASKNILPFLNRSGCGKCLHGLSLETILNCFSLFLHIYGKVLMSKRD